MKTNPAARRRQISAALSVLVVLALSACASAPSSASATADPVRAGQSQTVQTVQASPHAQPSPAASAARANRRMFAVAYSPSGSVVVTSSGAPTVEQLPSGLFRVTFPLATAQAPEVAQASR